MKKTNKQLIKYIEEILNQFPNMYFESPIMYGRYSVYVEIHRILTGEKKYDKHTRRLSKNRKWKMESWNREGDILTMSKIVKVLAVINIIQLILVAILMTK